MWPIPFSVFATEAKAAMKGENCNVKRALSARLGKTHPSPQKRYLFVQEAAKANEVKAPTYVFLSSLGDGVGDRSIAAAVWYELHCSEDWKHYAEDVDRTAFGGQTFEEAFADACAKYLADSGQWRLVGDDPLQAARELRWNFDLNDRQPAANAQTIGVYLEVASELEDLGDNMYGFRALHVGPRLSGSATDVRFSEDLRTPHPAGEDATVRLFGTGKVNSFWTIASTTQAPLRGFFTTDQAVMTIDPSSEPLTFSARMIAESRDVCDQYGNDQPRDVKDAFLQALFTKDIGERDAKSDSIVLFEMKYTVRRALKS